MQDKLSDFKGAIERLGCDDLLKKEAEDFVYNAVANKWSPSYVQDAVTGGAHSLKMFLGASFVVCVTFLLPAFFVTRQDRDNVAANLVGLFSALSIIGMASCLLFRNSSLPQRPSFFGTPVEKEVTSRFGVEGKKFGIC